MAASREAEQLFRSGPAPPGPKGAQAGDLILAERGVWRVEAIDPQRREAIARLTWGSHAVRRFRARRIERVWHAPGGASESPAAAGAAAMIGAVAAEAHAVGGDSQLRLTATVRRA